jgi:transposase-like protein
VPRSYPPEFRRKVLDLIAAGRPVAQIAADLDISDQTIYNWRPQHLIDTGQMIGITSSDHAELVAVDAHSVAVRSCRLPECPPDFPEPAVPQSP